MIILCVLKFKSFKLLNKSAKFLFLKVKSIQSNKRFLNVFFLKDKKRIAKPENILQVLFKNIGRSSHDIAKNIVNVF